jgi:hypothetical protein
MLEKSTHLIDQRIAFSLTKFPGSIVFQEPGGIFLAGARLEAQRHECGKYCIILSFLFLPRFSLYWTFPPFLLFSQNYV